MCLYSTRHNELENGILSSFLNKKQKHYKSLVFVENMTYAFMKHWVEGELMDEDMFKDKRKKSCEIIEKDDGSNVRSHLFDVFIV